MEEKNEQIFNQEVPGSHMPGFSPIYRQKGIKQLLQTPDLNIRTVRDIVEQCRDKFGNKRGLGQIVVDTENDQQGNSVEMRSLQTYTYKEIVDRAYNLGKALTARKLYFQEPERKMKLVGIYSKNVLEWFITDWACCLFGYTTVPLYDTLGKDNLEDCIETTQITTLFISAKTALGVVKFNLKGTLKTVISYDRLPGDVVDKIKDAGLELIYYEDLLAEGGKSKITNSNVIVKPDDIYSFCYTSGTTGMAKGALISHRNMLAAISSFILHKRLPFLPASSSPHGENCSQYHVLQWGLPRVDIKVFSNSSGNNTKIKEDNAFVKGTIFISVPRVYTRIVDEVNKTISSMANNETQRKAVACQVYHMVRESYGGSIRIMATGSAPITAQVQQTMQCIMGCPLIQGYGQTEGTCALVFSRSTKSGFTIMHELSPACEIKLCNLPELKYTANDTDAEGRATPRGEIWARGPQIFQGYYKRDDLTSETINPEGWVKTGDVGMIVPNLGLKIIDRIKHIFKLQQGQYVAPDKIERIYLKTGLLEEVFIHGTSIYTFAVAICTPNRERISKIAANVGVEGSWEEICMSKTVRMTVLGYLNAFARQHGILGFQLAKNIFFDLEGFSSKKILTNTMKLIRFQARQCYKEQIEKMYLQGELTM